MFGLSINIHRRCGWGWMLSSFMLSSYHSLHTVYSSYLSVPPLLICRHLPLPAAFHISPSHFLSSFPPRFSSSSLTSSPYAWPHPHSSFIALFFPSQAFPSHISTLPLLLSVFTAACLMVLLPLSRSTRRRRDEQQNPTNASQPPALSTLTAS